MAIHQEIDWKGREKRDFFELFLSLFRWKLAICPFSSSLGQAHVGISIKSNEILRKFP